MKTTFNLVGHKFTLKNIQYGIHSEETPDFMADLYCDGKFLCYCENDGHGGATFTHCTPETRDRYFEIMEEVAKKIWLTCRTGDVIYYSLGTVADEILLLVEQNKLVAKLQRNSLVLRRPEDYTPVDLEIYHKNLDYNGTSVKVYVQDYPGTLAKKIAMAQDEGWEVLNTNIPKKIYEAAKKWRDPFMKEKVTPSLEN